MANYGVFGVIESVVRAKLPRICPPKLPHFLMTIPAELETVIPAIAKVVLSPITLVDTQLASLEAGALKKLDEAENAVIGAIKARNPITGKLPADGDAVEPTGDC